MNSFTQHFQPLLAPWALPTHALPPLLRDSVHEAQTNIQAPVPLIFAGALTAITLVSQGLIDVKKPNGQQVPVSLMLLTIADSGERKSTVENIFLAPVRQFQNEQKALYQQKLTEYQAKQVLWEAQQKSILKAIAKKTTQNTTSGEEEHQFMEHEAKKPAKPRLFKLLYEDATVEVLFAGLHHHWPSAGLISSEGGDVLNGPALHKLSKQNAIWSGDSITVDRVTADNYELINARLTTALMVQESAFQNYMQRHGEKSRGSGLWARFLVCQPVSTQGTRFLQHTSSSWTYCDQFSQRISELLAQNLALLSDPTRPKQVLQFCAQACTRWLEIFNAIESQCRPFGLFAGAHDHAAKLADNIVRVAALLHYFEGIEGDIPLHTLETAIQIGLWYSAEFRRIFVPPPPIPQEVLDATALDNYLWTLRRRGGRYIRKNSLMQYGPKPTRNKNRLNKAIDILISRSSITELTYFKTNYIDLHPQFAPDFSAWQTATSKYEVKL